MPSTKCGRSHHQIFQATFHRNPCRNTTIVPRLIMVWTASTGWIYIKLSSSFTCEAKCLRTILTFQAFRLWLYTTWTNRMCDAVTWKTRQQRNVFGALGRRLVPWIIAQALPSVQMLQPKNTGTSSVRHLEIFAQAHHSTSADRSWYNRESSRQSPSGTKR